MRPPGRLIEAGVDAERISRDFLVVRGSPVRKVLETARSGNFATIVVGRRQALSFAEEYIWGRFSEKTIKMAENMAVWTISWPPQCCINNMAANGVTFDGLRFAGSHVCWIHFR